MLSAVAVALDATLQRLEKKRSHNHERYEMKVVTRRFSVFSPIGYTGVRMLRIAALGTLLITGVMCSAQDTLARLIPPDAPVLAGMQRSSTDNEYDRVWLATAQNLKDLKDFISLTDADASRRFDRVMVAASPAENDLLGASSHRRGAFRSKRRLSIDSVRCQ